MTVHVKEYGKFVDYKVDTRWAISFDINEQGQRVVWFVLKDGKGTEKEIPIENAKYITA